MASTRSIRQGQVEIGSIEHAGHEYAAYGATVVRRDITAYIKFKRGHYWLTSWAGGTKLDCRSEVIERFWDGSLALMFRLPKGRFITGTLSPGSDNGPLALSGRRFIPSEATSSLLSGRRSRIGPRTNVKRDLFAALR